MENEASTAEQSVAALMDVADETQPETTDSGDALGLGTSTLGAAIQSTNQRLFDPLAQMMDSDADSESDDEPLPLPKPAALPSAPENKLHLESSLLGTAAKAPERSSSNLQQRVEDESQELGATMKPAPLVPKLEFKQTDFALRKQSIVARLTAKGAISSQRAVSDDSDGSSSDSDKELSANARMEMDDSESEPELGEIKKKQREPKKPKAGSTDSSPPKQRAASKAAILKMHQETERLVRETQVHIDPTEFTKRLRLSDFFTRFDSEKADAVSRKQRKQDALESKQKLRFSADSDDEVEIEIVGPKQQILAHGARSSRLFACAQKKKEEEKKDRDRLATILRYGSQPMHVSGALPAAKKADGPLALRSLNSALLEAVHKQDMGRKRKDKRHGEDSSQVIGDDEDEDMAMEDNGVEIDDEDVAMEEDSGSDADEPQPRTGSRKVVISDDEGDTVEESKPVGVSKPKPAEYPQSKAKFLGMFKMPAKKPAASPAAKPEEARVESSPTSDDPQVLPSQDLSYIFSGDHGLQTDTQDSLLLTPSAGTQQAAQQTTQPITQLTQQGTQPTQLLQQSMDPLGLLNSSLLAGDSQMSVGIPALGDGIPTQMTQSLQPTVPDREDSQSSDIPTLVRQALQLELSDDDGDDRPETAAEASSARAEKPGDQHPEIADESDGSQPRRRGRLLQRRAQLDEKKKKKMGRLERSEFLEDEAEEGESSDSDNDGQRTIRHRKFDWGNDSQANIPSDSENEFHELDTDEEAEQLLADPLINNEDMSDEEGNEAIRELHRQRAMEDDEKAIQELAKDIATGNLRNRGRARNLLGLDEEDYNDRQSRQERMEERARLRRKLMAKEIHDTNLAAIAKNPETAAFANAALMRPPTQSTRGSSSQAPAGDDDGDDDDEDDLLNDEMLDLEEEIDENSVAAAVQQQLSRPRMRIESDDDDNGSSDNDSSKQGSMGVRLADGSGFSTRMNSSQTSSNGLVGLADDCLDTPLSVESLIVRRKTLNSKSTLLPPGPGSLLKRPGASLLQSPMAKRYNAMKK